MVEQWLEEMLEQWIEEMLKQWFEEMLEQWFKELLEQWLKEMLGQWFGRDVRADVFGSYTFLSLYLSRSFPDLLEEKETLSKTDGMGAKKSRPDVAGIDSKKNS